MTTPYWSDFVPNSTFYRILSGFQRTFATGVACRLGTPTPPDTWSRPFGTCICSTCWDQSFSELVVILPDYALRISLGTFSILLRTCTDKTVKVSYRCLKSCYDISDICPIRTEIPTHEYWENVFILLFVWLVVIGFRQNYFHILPYFGDFGAKKSFFRYVINQKRKMFF